MTGKIKYLHTPIEEIDRPCREEEKVEVMINIYHTEYYRDGTSELVQTGGFGGTIRSSKKLSKQTKHQLR